MGTGGQIFGLIIALVLVVGFFGMLAEAREEAEAEAGEGNFDHDEGDAYDENL